MRRSTGGKRRTGALRGAQVALAVSHALAVKRYAWRVTAHRTYTRCATDSSTPWPWVRCRDTRSLPQNISALQRVSCSLRSRCRADSRTALQGTTNSICRLVRGGCVLIESNPVRCSRRFRAESVASERTLRFVDIKNKIFRMEHSGVPPCACGRAVRRRVCIGAREPRAKGGKTQIASAVEKEAPTRSGSQTNVFSRKRVRCVRQKR